MLLLHVRRDERREGKDANDGDGDKDREDPKRDQNPQRDGGLLLLCRH